MLRLTDRPDMTIAVYRGRKTTITNVENLLGQIQIAEQLMQEVSC